MPESPAHHRPSATALVQTGAVAAAAAAVITLTGGAASAATTSKATSHSATEVSDFTGGPFGGTGPAMDWSGQSAQSPFQPLGGQPAARTHTAARPEDQVRTHAPARTAARSVRPARPALDPTRSSPDPGAAIARGVRHQAWSLYDSVTPTAIPSGRHVATYATGPFAVGHQQIASRRSVFWIDVNGSDSHADALDVEPGDASPASAANWAWRKLNADHDTNAIIYTMRSEWPATKAAVSRLPQWMQARVRWWIADPTGYPHLVPGSNATQWYWGKNWDISLVEPGF